MEVLSNSPMSSERPSLPTPPTNRLYGNLVVLGKDNVQKSSYPITEGEIVIGREKDCDIRIKLSSVSRNQCKLFIDENDQVALVNLSTTNFTVINGNPLTSTEMVVTLKSGDVISVAERSFIFYSNKVSDNCYKPVLEAIDEAKTVDFSKRADLQTAVTNDENSNPNKQHLAKSPVASKSPAAARIAMNNSILADIEARRKSYGAPKSPLVATTVKSPKERSVSLNSNILDAINSRRISYGNTSVMPEVSTAAIEAPAVSHLKTPLREAINARRKSFSNIVTQPVVEVSTADAPLSMSTPLKAAIKARRKSGIPVVAKISSTTPAAKASSSVDDAPAAAAVLMMAKMKTPLKNAINARRKSFVPPPPAMLVPPAPPAQVTEKPKKALGTPIRQAIASRRKSGVQQANTPKSTKKTAGVSSTPNQHVEAFNENISMAISARKSLDTKTARQVTCEMVATLHDESSLLSKFKKLPTPIRIALGNRRVSYSAATPQKFPLSRQSLEGEQTEDVPSATPAVDEVEESNGNDTAAIISVESTKITNDIIAAICTQISVDAFANELELQNVPPAIAYEEAVKIFLEDPVSFETGTAASLSLNTTPMKINHRERNSLLASIEKKGSEMKASVELTSELISSLTDSEMIMIDSYAHKLSVNNVDESVCFGLALDFFVKGVERCHAMINEAATAPDVDVDDVIADENEKSVVEETEEDALFFGASLRTLFKAPYAFASDEQAHMELVDLYALELQECAYVDSAIAYGISLDSYIADPIAFVENVSKITKYNLNYFSVDDEVDMFFTTPERWAEMSVMKSPYALNMAVQWCGSKKAFADDDEEEAVKSAAKSVTKSAAKSVTKSAAKSVTKSAAKSVTKSPAALNMSAQWSGSKKTFVEEEEEEEEEAEEEEEGAVDLITASATPVKAATPAPASALKAETPALASATPLKTATPAPASALKAATPASASAKKVYSEKRANLCSSLKKCSSLQDILNVNAEVDKLYSSRANSGRKSSAVEAEEVVEDVFEAPMFELNDEVLLSPVPSVKSSAVESAVKSAVKSVTKSVTKSPAALNMSAQWSGSKKSIDNDLNEVAMTSPVPSIRSSAVKSVVKSISKPVAESPAPVVVISAKKSSAKQQSGRKSIEVDIADVVPVAFTLEEPAPVIEEEPAPVIEEEPVPVIEEEPVPVQVMVDVPAPIRSRRAATKPAPAAVAKAAPSRSRRTKAVVEEEVAVVIVEEKTVVEEEVAVESKDNKRKRNVEFSEVVQIKEIEKRPEPEAPKAPAARKRAAAKAPAAPASKKGKKVIEIVEEVVVEEEEEEVETVILCDGCDGEFTLQQAKLEVVPEGEWHCTKCAKKGKAKAASKAKAVPAAAPVEEVAEVKQPAKRSRAAPKDVVEEKSVAPTRRSSRK